MAQHPEHTVRPDAAALPLTAAQQAIVDACGLAGHPGHYIVGEVLELTGAGLDPDRVAAAVAATAAEAEVLRLRLRERDGAWTQEVAPEPPPAPELVDLRAAPDPRALAAAVVDAERAGLAEATADLAGVPLSRYRLLRLAEDELWCVQLYHHVAVDGYSAHLLTRRIAEHHRALVTGAAPRPPRFAPIAELVAADRAYAAGAEHAADRRFWAGRLAAATVAPGREDQVGDGSAAMTTVRTLDPAARERLTGLARAHRVGWTDLVLAAHAALLRRITGQPEVTIAMPMLARTTPAALRTPLMLVNMLPLTVPVDPGAPLVELAAAIRAELAAIRPHSRFPGSALARAADRPEAAALLHGMGANVKAFDARFDFGGPAARLRNVAGGPPEDLVLVVAPAPDGSVDLAFEHDPRNTPPELAAGRLERMRAILDGACADPAAPLGALGAGAGARWRAAAPTAPAGAPAPSAAERIDALADGEPGRTALVVEAADGSGPELRMSAAELLAAVRALARRVRAGAPRGAVVAVTARRSAEQVIALLACLHAGRTAVVADPDGGARTAAVLAAADPALVLDDAALAGARRPDPAAAGPRDWPDPDPEEIAYLMFTSGSTGTPKGVRVPHRALAALLAGHAAGLHPEVLAALPAGAALAVGHTAPLHFDAAIDQLAWLFAGARVHLLPEPLLLAPAACAGRLAAAGIGILDATPSLLAPLLELGLLERCPDLAAILCGGEPMPQDLWDRLAAAEVAAWNLYGPTEATVDALAARVRPGPVHLGEPVPGMTAAAVDLDGAEVPPGEWGELVLAGPQIAAGYLGADGAAFGVLETAGGAAAAYRTGDRVRREPGRGWVFGGRLDDQLEVRGHRVEPGEVEALLRGAPGVADAAAAADAAGGATRLVAAVRPADPADAAPAAAAALARRVTADLAGRAPAWLVPGGVAVVDRLPVTAQGKTDRRAVAALVAAAAAGDPAATGPRDEAGRFLAAEIGAVLGVDPGRVRLDLDFISGGGDSIAALRVAAACARAGRRLDAAELLGPTPLAELAARLPGPGAAAGEPAAADPGPGAAGPLGRVPADPARVGAGGCWTALVEPDRPVPARALAAAAGDLAASYGALRAIAAGPAGAPGELLVPRTPAAAAERIGAGCVDQAPAGAGPGELLALARAGVDPGRGRMWRLARAADGRRLAVAAHPAALDAESFAMLLRRLRARLAAGAAVDPVDARPTWRGAAVAAAGAAPAPPDPATGGGDGEAGVAAVVELPPAVAAATAAGGAIAEAYRCDPRACCAAAARLAGAQPVQVAVRPPRAAGVLGALAAPRVLPAAEPAPAAGADDPDRARRVLLDTKERLLAGPGDAGPAAVAVEVVDEPVAEAPGPAGMARITVVLPGPGAARPAGRVLVAGPDPEPARALAEAVARSLATLAAAARLRPGASPADLRGLLDQDRIDAHEARLGPLADAFGTTPMQRALLARRTAAGPGGGYVVAAGIDLHGPVDPGRLRAAFAELMRRHPVLRAGFDPEAPGGPVHLIPRRAAPPWRTLDLRDLPEEAGLAAAAAVQRDYAARDIDVTDPPLLAATLVLLPGERSRLVLGNHHLLTDGWSTPVLLRDLLELYHGRDPQPARPADFADHVARIAARDAAADRARWSRLLADLPGGTLLSVAAPPEAGEPPAGLADLDWPADAPDRAEVAARIAEAAPAGTATVLPVPLPAATAAALPERARELGLTPATLVQAGWAVALAGALGLRDVVFGVTLAGRDPALPGVEATVGMFITTLPMRLRVDPAATLAELAADAAGMGRELAGLQTTALPEAEAAGGVGPLFDSVVVHDNHPVADGDPDAAPAAESPRVGRVRTSGRAEVPLAVVAPPGEDAGLGVAHEPELISPRVAVALAGRLARALTALVADPAAPVGPLLGEPEVGGPGAVPGPAPTAPTAEAAEPADAAAGQPDREAIADTIAEAMAGLLGRPVAAGDNFFTIGGDSLAAMRLLGRLRPRLPELTVVQIVEGGSPREIAARLGGGAAGARLLAPLRGGFGAPLVCVHPAGGVALPFTPLAAALPWPTPVAGISLPTPRPEVPDLAGLAGRYVEALRRELPEGPYRLLGYSFGGQVAHAMAARLQDAGAEVDFLGVLDAYPCGHGPGVGEPDAELRARLAAAEAGELPAAEIAAVAGIPPAAAARAAAAGVDIAGNLLYCGRLLRTATPVRYDGEVAVVAATRPTPGAPAAAGWDPIAAWRGQPGITAVHGTRLDLDHAGLVGEDGAAQVAAFLAGLRP